MIGRIRGTLVHVEGPNVLVEVGGVGYEVLAPDSVVLGLPPVGAEATLWTRQIFREDGQWLYGFADVHQRRIFDMLTEVKGCGPKISLALIGQVGEETILAAILSQDVKPLCRATGVGARLAERILLELKDKVQEEALRRKIEVSQSNRAAVKPDDELVDALLNLGYRRAEAEIAADKAGDGALEDRLKAALKALAK